MVEVETAEGERGRAAPLQGGGGGRAEAEEEFREGGAEGAVPEAPHEWARQEAAWGKVVRLVSRSSSAATPTRRTEPRDESEAGAAARCGAHRFLCLGGAGAGGSAAFGGGLVGPRHQTSRPRARQRVALEPQAVGRTPGARYRSCVAPGGVEVCSPGR